MEPSTGISAEANDSEVPRLPIRENDVYQIRNANDFRYGSLEDRRIYSCDFRRSGENLDNYFQGNMPLREQNFSNQANYTYSSPEIREPDGDAGGTYFPYDANSGNYVDGDRNGNNGRYMEYAKRHSYTGIRHNVSSQSDMSGIVGAHSDINYSIPPNTDSDSMMDPSDMNANMNGITQFSLSARGSRNLSPPHSDMPSMPFNQQIVVGSQPVSSTSNRSVTPPHSLNTSLPQSMNHSSSNPRYLSGNFGSPYQARQNATSMNDSVMNDSANRVMPSAGNMNPHMSYLRSGNNMSHNMNMLPPPPPPNQSSPTSSSSATVVLDSMMNSNGPYRNQVNDYSGGGGGVYVNEPGVQSMSLNGVSSSMSRSHPLMQSVGLDYPNSFDADHSRYVRETTDGVSQNGSVHGRGTVGPVDISRVERGEETRTVVMLKNIPNRFSRDDVCRTLDECSKNKYNVLHMPLDQKTRRNLGYCFIQFTTSVDLIQAYHCLQDKCWPGSESLKRCHFWFAKIQNPAEFQTTNTSPSAANAPNHVNNIPNINSNVGSSLPFYPALSQRSSTQPPSIRSPHSALGPHSASSSTSPIPSMDNEFNRSSTPQLAYQRDGVGNRDANLLGNPSLPQSLSSNYQLSPQNSNRPLSGNTNSQGLNHKYSQLGLSYDTPPSSSNGDRRGSALGSGSADHPFSVSDYQELQVRQLRQFQSQAQQLQQEQSESGTMYSSHSMGSTKNMRPQSMDGSVFGRSNNAVNDRGSSRLTLSESINALTHSNYPANNFLNGNSRAVASGQQASRFSSPYNTARSSVSANSEPGSLAMGSLLGEQGTVGSTYGPIDSPSSTPVPNTSSSSSGYSAMNVLNSGKQPLDEPPPLPPRPEEAWYPQFDRRSSHSMHADSRDISTLINNSNYPLNIIDSPSPIPLSHQLTSGRRRSTNIAQLPPNSFL